MSGRRLLVLFFVATFGGSRGSFWGTPPLPHESMVSTSDEAEWPQSLEAMDLKNESQTFNNLKESRAYSHSVVMNLQCKSPCPLDNKAIWQYRKSSESQWNNITNFTMNHIDLYTLRGLEPNNTYYIQVLVNESTIFNSAKPVRTCPKTPPNIWNLYVATTGPGWLDIRWTPPQQFCKCEVKYWVRYRLLVNSSFITEKPCSFLEVPPAAHGVPRPFYPCAFWPYEFCVLLTDHVMPGQKHNVEVRYERFEPDRITPIYSKWSSVIALADTTTYGKPVSCSYENSRRGKAVQILKASEEIQQPDGVPVNLWIAALAGTVVLIAVIAAIFAVRKACISSRVSPVSPVCEKCSPKKLRRLSSDQEMYDYPRFRIGNFRISRRSRRNTGQPTQYRHFANR